MYIAKNKKGEWFIQYSYVNWKGERERTTKRGFKTKREAQDWYNRFMTLNSREFNMSFRDFVQEIYLPDMEKRVKVSTMETKKYIIKLKLLPYFGEKRMNDISVADIRKWQKELLGKGYAQTYLRAHQQQLSALFNYAEKYYNLRENPTKRAGGIGKCKADEMSIYTREQFDTLCDALINKRMSWIAFHILYYTGIRIGELLALQIKDVDFDKKLLTVNKSLQRIKRQDIITEPKTPRSIRKISMPDFLLVDLQDYIESMGEVSITDRLFPVTKYYFEHELKRGIKESGLHHIRLHDLRHSHASLLIEMGFSPIAVADRLGHEKVSTTLNIYGHLFPNKQAGMAEKLNDFYREGL